MCLVVVTQTMTRANYKRSPSGGSYGDYHQHRHYIEQILAETLVGFIQ